MAEVVGIRFKRTGKIYYFDAAGLNLEANEYAIVETARGVEMGQVIIAPRQVVAEEITEPLKPVLRKASDEDVARAQEFKAKEAEALEECACLVTRLELPMKLLSAEYNFDGSHLLFSFSAEERVDFRKLVRELTSRFRNRVELRQIGPRDEAKITGGYGRCGRRLCCASFLCDFDPVSIKMAKEQDLPLNPMKISGCCGRLLCCLVYENELYRCMKGKLPKQGQYVLTPMGRARVVGSNTLKETILAELESQAVVEFPISDITIEKKESPQAAQS